MSIRRAADGSSATDAVERVVSTTGSVSWQSTGDSGDGEAGNAAGLYITATQQKRSYADSADRPERRSPLPAALAP